MYTGDLTYVHALALRMLGDTFMSLRWVLLFSFLLWVPAVFYVASWFGSPLSAAGVTALAILWSVPNYLGAGAIPVQPVPGGLSV